MYEVFKTGVKTNELVMKDLDERKISMLFATLTLSSMSNISDFLKIIENSKLDKETEEKFFYESLYFHLRRIISSKVILDEIKEASQESSAHIKKKLRGELEKFSLRNNWLIEDSIKEYEDNIEVGRSENLDYSMTLILRRIEAGQDKRPFFKKKLKESFYENEKNTLREIKKGIKNKNLDQLMLYLGNAVFQENTTFESEQLELQCNDIGNKLANFLANELKEGSISVALHSIFIQGLITSINYRKLIEIKHYENEELENAIFEIGFFHTRLLIRNKEVLNKLGGYAEGREVKKELLTELDNLVVRSGKDLKKTMSEFKNASKRERSIGEKEYITSRALALWKQDEKIREIFEFYFKNAQNNSLNEINELLIKMENTIKKAEMESLLFRKA